MKQPNIIKEAVKLLKERAQYKNSPLSYEEDRRLYTETWILPLLDAIENGDLKGLREILY